MAGSKRPRSQAAAALGAELKEIREGRDVTTRELAVMLGRKPTDSGLISRWESGERVPKPDDVARVIEALDIEGDEAADLMASVNGARAGGRWVAFTLPERRQQLNAVLATERTATTVVHVAPLIIPGLLQTSDVIRSMMVEGGVPADEIDERVMVRIGRRELITRREPAQLNVLLGESAIRQVLGGPAVMAEQLRYLREMAELPNVEIRAVANSAGWTPALTGAFILLESETEQPVVSVELNGCGLLLQDLGDIEVHRRAAEAVRMKAMSPARTAKLIAEVIAELEEAK
ncbi:helix-turn-helix domain-containing protein [Amycolatopsis samaneae]|uniref:Helix-turn-helix transcriptional regulator n=1 Tax=Amycolatopsis samaneae TaxID=664691 RepID=A0ABW5G6X8_9PSEU